MSRNPAPIVRGVVFDAFGTLLEIGERRRPYKRLQELMAQHGRPPQPEDAVRMLTTNTDLKGLLAMLNGSLSIDIRTIEEDLAAEVAMVRAFEDAAPTLGTFRALGLRLAVCSNLAAPYGKPIREQLPPVDAYALSYEVGAVKPDPAIYAHVCEELDCHPRELLFVGDTLAADFTGPRAFGMQAVHLQREGEPVVEPTIRSLTELLHLKLFEPSSK